MVEKRLMKDSDKIELTSGGLTSLHSHSGGGGGDLIDKAGCVTTDGSGEAAVSFNSNYASTNYTVQLTVIHDDAAIGIVKLGTKTVSGFTVVAYDDRGNTLTSVDVEWTTGLYSNP